MSFAPITLGRIVRAHSRDGITVTQTEHGPGTVLTMHAHELPNLTLVVRGGFREAVKGRSFTAAPYDILVKRPGERHANEYGATATRGLSVELDETSNAQLGRLGDVLLRTAHVRHGCAADALRRILPELMIGDAASALSIPALVCEALAELMRTSLPRRRPAWMPDVVRFLDQHFAETVSLASAAETFGIERTQLARWFRRQQGVTVGQYVRRRRIEFARAELREGRKSIAEIAAAAGFADHAHFCRVFKKVTGATPRVFRADGRESTRSPS